MKLMRPESAAKILTSPRKTIDMNPLALIVIAACLYGLIRIAWSVADWCRGIEEDVKW